MMLSESETTNVSACTIKSIKCYFPHLFLCRPSEILKYLLHIKCIQCRISPIRECVNARSPVLRRTIVSTVKMQGTDGL